MVGRSALLGLVGNFLYCYNEIKLNGNCLLGTNKILHRNVAGDEKWIHNDNQKKRKS